MERDEDLFAAAAELPPAARQELLARVCRDDPSRRALLEQLLQAHDDAGGFLAAPAVSRATELTAEKAGDVIDRYRLLQRIGEGGVGVVWMAQQEQPLRRLVAFKVIKLGMDTKAVVARFEGERQALARMDHPNIAKVFDAGVTSTGRPYFVMELVRGTLITKYCDEHHYTTAQRLELFVAVCEALQHAHQKGVIHRDLKPSNILVTENGGVALPKVIDFGIAKATQGQLGEETVFTAFEHFIGTPTYMSPEQTGMSSLDLDTRSDIYSLGVLLFELLTGHTPFDAGTFLKGGVDQIRQRIREEEPSRPSARLGTLAEANRQTVAQQRGTAPAQLALELRGDLDWIVLRCLEKDRTRRYASASALADDIRRHLRFEPVLARPPSAFYVATKLIRRHRAAFVAVAVTTLVVVVGGSISAWQAVRATRAEREQSRLRVIERELRQRAETQERVAQRRAYAADMNLAQQALANDNLGLAKRLLDRHRPDEGAADLRGWEWRYLWQVTQSEAVSVFARMPHQVSGLSLSRDGHWLALSQTEGGEVSIRNMQTRQELRLPVGIGAVRAVFSPTEPLLAIAYINVREPQPEHRVRLWSLATRQVVRDWASPVGSGPLFFSADGQTLATAGARGNQLAAWRVPTGEAIAVPASAVGGGGGGGAGGAVVAVASDGRLAAREVSRDGRDLIQVFDLVTGVERWNAGSQEESVSALAFSPDGALLAAASGNTGSSIRLWDTVTGQLLGRLDGHRTYIAGLLFWPDSKTLASAGTDQTVRLWDVEKRVLRRTLRGHELEVHSLALLPDNTTLVSGAKDGAVLLWDTAAPVATRQLSFDSVASWRPAPDGRSILTVDQTGVITRRSGRDFERADVVLELRRSQGSPGWGGGPSRVSFSADAPLVAVSVGGGVVGVSNWETRQVVRELSTGATQVAVLGFVAGAEKVLLAHEGSAPERHGLHEWDLGSGLKTRSWPTFEATGQQGPALTDGKRILLRRPDDTLTLVDLGTGAARQVAALAPSTMSAGFSPDGRLLASASRVGWVKVLDLSSAETVAELSGFVLGVHSAAFSSDGRRLITGSGGAEAIRMWDVDGFEALLTLGAQGTVFTSAAFFADGNVIGARNAQGRLYLWRAPSFAEIAEAERR